MEHETPIVCIEQGKLMGRVREDINGKSFKSFEGIPYAQPPVGTSRFKPPEPAIPWNEDILDCTKGKSSVLSRRRYYPQNWEVNEDCLYLNIYTPETLTNDDAKKYPVMFWIHGGAFTFGMGNVDFYGPEYLVAKKVVLVTINYRLGYLGFFQLNDPSLNVTGNAGLKDQVEALRWVKNNINVFGGDANNVTIFGQGFGAEAVHLHMMSPLSRNLFHKAIMQSGCALCSWSFNNSLRRDYELPKILGCQSENDEEILNFLQKQSMDSILNSQLKLIKPEMLMAGELNRVTPSVEPQSDFAFLTKSPEEIIIEGTVARVPLLTGYNSHEGLLMCSPTMKTCLSSNFNDSSLLLPRDLRNMLKNQEDILNVGNKIQQFYYENQQPSFDNLDPYIKFYTDEMFAYKILSAARAHSQSKNQVYVYVWTLDTMLNIIRIISGKNYKGVSHGDELGYLFKNKYSLEKPKRHSPEKFGIEVATTFWTNFAYTGNPNSSTSGRQFHIDWKPFANNELNCLKIGYLLQHAPTKCVKDILNLWDRSYSCVKNVSFQFPKILSQIRL